MRVGGATLTNVVLLILDDENLQVGSGPDAYQISAVLGYPILEALGVVTFTRDEFLAGEGQSQLLDEDVPLWRAAQDSMTLPDRCLVLRRRRHDVSASLCLCGPRR
jgi:hypothetical protein